MGSELVEGGCTILRLFLEVTHSLDFKFLLLSEALVFAGLGLFSLYGSALMVSNLLIKMPFRLPGGRFLHECVLVGDPDLVIAHLDAPRLLLLHLDLLEPHLLNVGLQLGLLQLEHLLLLLPLDLPRCNLLNDHLSTSFTGGCGPLFTLMLGFERFKPFELHHEVKSLLLVDPILL